MLYTIYYYIYTIYIYIYVCVCIYIIYNHIICVYIYIYCGEKNSRTLNRRKKKTIYQGHGTSNDGQGTKMIAGKRGLSFLSRILWVTHGDTMIADSSWFIHAVPTWIIYPNRWWRVSWCIAHGKAGRLGWLAALVQNDGHIQQHGGTS